MKKVKIISLLILIFISDNAIAQTKYSKVFFKGDSVDVYNNDIIVKIRQNQSTFFAEFLKENTDFEYISHPYEKNYQKLRIKGKSNVGEMIKLLQSQNIFEFVEPNLLRKALAKPNDEKYQLGRQWYIDKVNLRSAWDITTGDPNLVIGILDSGIPMVNNSLNHWDLNSSTRYLIGCDAINDGNSVKDQYGHGTHVLGIAGALSNNTTGIVGVNWNSKFLICQVFDINGNSAPACFSDAVHYAVVYGAKIINYSGGGSVESDLDKEAISYAADHNVLIVCGAGNAGGVVYPAKYANQYENIMAISATDVSDNFALNYSSQGPEVTVSAPGLTIYSTTPTYNFTLHSILAYEYDYYSGTSMASPIVAGIASLLKSLHSELTPIQIKKILEYTAFDLGSFGRDDQFGFGRVDSWKALDAINHRTTNGTLPRDEIWYGTITLSGNVTVPSGVKLTILSNATINLSNYSIISSSGTITVENGAIINSLKALVKAGNDIKGIYPSSYTIQQLINLSSSGWLINLVAGTYAENISMGYGVGVQGAGINSTTIDGSVTFSNASWSGLADVTVNDIISVSNSNGVTLYNVKSGSADCYVDASGSDVSISNMTSETTQTRGLYAHNSSSYWVDLSTFKHKYDGQHLEDVSYGTNEGVTFCQNVTSDIVAFNSSYVDNNDCTFSSGTEGSTVYGDVYWSSWDYCGLSKIAAGMTKTSTTNGNDDPGLNDYKTVMNQYKTVRDKIKNDKKAGKGNTIQNYAAELKNVVDEFKKFIDVYNGSKYSPVVLGTIASVSESLEENQEMLSYMLKIADDKKLDHLRPYALSNIATLYVKTGENQKGIELSNQLLEEYPGHTLAVEWLYSKGLIYKYNLNDKTKAEEMFKEVISKYPDHATAISAKEQLGIKEKYIPKEQATTAQVFKEFTISNYPNPFNPATTISYSIPEDGKVQIKVFDVLGKEISTLMDGFVNAGSHNIVWDGSSFASGIYFYSIQFKGQMLNKKMLLVK